MVFRSEIKCIMLPSIKLLQKFLSYNSSLLGKLNDVLFSWLGHKDPFFVQKALRIMFYNGRRFDDAIPNGSIYTEKLLSVGHSTTPKVKINLFVLYFLKFS